MVGMERPLVSYCLRDWRREELLSDNLSIVAISPYKSNNSVKRTRIRTIITKAVPVTINIDHRNSVSKRTDSYRHRAYRAAPLPKMVRRANVNVYPVVGARS